MILWQKQASPRWLAKNEPHLEVIAGPNLVITSRPGHVRVLVQVMCETQLLARQLQRDFGGVARSMPRNWWKATVSEPLHAPIRIGRRLEIVSQKSRTARNAKTPQLIIPAAGAFGTGEHATTAMSLRLLGETTRKLPAGWRSLDVGTGTGILALAARIFGAAEVLGLDNDPSAIAHARHNARLNHIGRAKFVLGSILQFKPLGRYEIVTANLFSELLIAALPVLQRALHPSGRLIVSGILRGQAESVVDAFRGDGLELETIRRRGKWVALLWRQSTLAVLVPRSASRRVTRSRRGQQRNQTSKT
jgi:ribosomal protein L11 methyltransferase